MIDNFFTPELILLSKGCIIVLVTYTLANTIDVISSYLKRKKVK